jgi:hypothetical protein
MYGIDLPPAAGIAARYVFYGVLPVADKKKQAAID